MIGEDALAAALPAHLAQQRWFGDREHAGESKLVEVGLVLAVAGGWPKLLRCEVAVREVRYQLVLGLRPSDSSGAVDIGESSMIGTLPSDEGPVRCYDALADPELSVALLRHIAPGEDVEDVRPILAEQSNSSLVYDERLILKVFRRLTGANPDVEVTTALAADGFLNVAAPYGVWRVDRDDCGIVQRFLAGGAEGWALAQTSLRDYFANGGAPAEAGGDFAPEAARLGVLTAELHVALAHAFGSEPGDGAAWAAAILESLTPISTAEVDLAAARDVIGRLAKVTRPGAAIRVHGDYHLGQVLRTDDGWFVVDFEGEPARPGEQRRAFSSPLRDVAGVLRSLHYASQVAKAEFGGDDAAAGLWELRNRNALLDAYRSTISGHRLAPDGDEFDTVLAAYEVDKAIYEVAYEEHHRPDWVGIPVAGVRRLTGPSA